MVTDPETEPASTTVEFLHVAPYVPGVTTTGCCTVIFCVKVEVPHSLVAENEYGKVP